MKYFLLISFLAFSLVQCQPAINPDFILGTWRDENSTVRYLSTGKWEGLAGEQVISTGTWKIEGEVLHMHIDRTGNDYSYKILSHAKDAFSIQSLGPDKAIFNKSRVE